MPSARTLLAIPLITLALVSTAGCGASDPQAAPPGDEQDIKSTTSLGELAAPGSALGGTVHTVAPGKSLSFTVGSNQISGIVGWEIDQKSLVSETDKIVKPMQAGQLGDKTYRQYTFAVDKSAASNSVIKITSSPTFQARNDKNWAFSFTIKVQ